MADQLPGGEPDVARVQAELREVAERLREAHHLSPADQQKLADLMEEMSGALGTAAVPSAEMLHLAQSATQLANHLHQQDQGLLAGARSHLQQTIARVGAKASPVAAIARRLIDALADIGI